MSLNKLFIHRQNSKTSGNKSLIGTFKFTKHVTRNVAVITVYGGHRNVNFAVNSYEPVGSTYKVRREKDLIAFGISLKDFASYQIERDISYVGKTFTLEFVPLDGAINPNFADGLPKEPMRFASINLVNLISFPTHLLIDGYQTYWSSQVGVITNTSLEAVFAQAPSSYTNFGDMFRTCNKLTTIPQNFLSNIDGTTVNSIDGMFYGCTELASGSIKLNMRNTSPYVNTRYMFFNCRKINDAFVNGLTEVNCYDMSYMFFTCTQITELNPSFNDNGKNPVTNNFASMFFGCTKYIGRSFILRCSTANGDEINLNDIYNGCAVFNGDSSGLRPATRSKADRAFRGCTALTGKRDDGTRIKYALKIGMNSTFEGVFASCSNFDGDVTDLTNGETVIGRTQAVLDQLDTFYLCSKFTGVGLDTLKVTIGGISAGGMFQGTAALGDVSLAGFSFATSIKSTRLMFQFSGWTGRGIGTGTGNWDFPNVVNSAYMFSGCVAFGTGGFTRLPRFFQTVPSTDSVYALSMFESCTNLYLEDISMIEMRYIRNAQAMFRSCLGFTDTDFNTAAPEKLEECGTMFYGCTNFQGVGLDFNTWKANGNKNFSATQMFTNCTNLKKIPTFDFTADIVTTVNLTSFVANCKGLDLSNLNSKFIFKGDLSQTAAIASAFSLLGNVPTPPNLNAFSTVRLTGISGAFNGWTAFNADVSALNLEVVNATVFGLENLFTATNFNGTGFREMLQKASNKVADLRFAITSMCTSCATLDVDLSGINNLKIVGNAGNAFGGCRKLKGTGFGNLDLSLTTGMSSMFKDCTEINFTMSPSWKAPVCVVADAVFHNCTAMEGYGVQNLFKNAPSVVSNLNSFALNANNWKQSLKDWCMTKVTVAPTTFASPGSFLDDAANKPVWGTCPVVP